MSPDRKARAKQRKARNYYQHDTMFLSGHWLDTVYQTLSIMLCGDASLAWDLLLAEKKGAQAKEEIFIKARLKIPRGLTPLETAVFRPRIRHKTRLTTYVTCGLLMWKNRIKQIKIAECSFCSLAETIEPSGVWCLCPYPTKDVLTRLKNWRDRGKRGAL